MQFMDLIPDFLKRYIDALSRTGLQYRILIFCVVKCATRHQIDGFRVLFEPSYIEIVECCRKVS
jgi:hypothetical protein